MNALDHTRIIVRPVAVPLPLAFAALAVGSIVVSAQELSWIAPEGGFEVGIVLVALVAPLQIIAALFGFLARDPVAGTGISLVAAAWLVAGLTRIVPEAEGTTFGVALLAVSLALAIPVIAASLDKRVVAALIALTAVRFALNGILAITGSPTFADLGGVVGICVSALAIYTALAIELEAIGRPVLPLGRSESAEVSVHGDLARQVQGIEHEAGVRRRL